MHLFRYAGLWVSAACLCPLLIRPVRATQPPRPGELKTYVRDGTWEQRKGAVLRTENHKVRSDVARRTMARLDSLSSGGRVPMEVLPNWEGMPTSGTNNVLVFLIDFSDYPHGNAEAVITNKLFGNGVPSEYPLESLRNYYIRSSYSNLFIQGNVLGWYRMANPRSWYTTTHGTGNAANRAIINEVLQHYDATHDYAQYDNNGDGLVDYFAVIWSGPDTGWGAFWWGYQWELDTPIVADGVQFSTFSWQWEANPVGSAFEAETIIHETGHALGLPDYYDYSPGLGPEGGLGGLDMMDHTMGDHNAFSKFMMEWITPTFVSGSQTTVVLQASAAYPSAAAVMPGYNGPGPFREYFMVQNRHRVQNDTNYPSDGLLIWHVDATPNARGDDFQFNNSDTSHKLLRLMEADGLEEIETGDQNADAGDYYRQGDTFLPYGTPNSQAYDGSNTWVSVDQISADGISMTARLSAEPGEGMVILERSPALLQQVMMEGGSATSQTFQVQAVGGFSEYTITTNATWLSVLPSAGSSSNTWNAHTVDYEPATLPPGIHQARITIASTSAVNPSLFLDVTLTVAGSNLASAVEATNLLWATGGDGIWFEQTAVTQDGEDAAQSGDVEDSRQSWIETTVSGPGTLTSWWKVSSESGWDFLHFILDGTQQPGSISGLTEWQQAVHVLPAGTHTCRWAYIKDGSVSSGADAGWLDRVGFVGGDAVPIIGVDPPSFSASVSQGSALPADILQIRNAGGGTMVYTMSDDADWLSVSPTTETSTGDPNQHQVHYTVTGLSTGLYNAHLAVSCTNAANSPVLVPVSVLVYAPDTTLADAVDAPALEFLSGGDARWTRQTTVTHDSVDAAQSGSIGDDQSSWMETGVEGPGTLRYWIKASSEEGFDFFELLLDGETQHANLSGDIDWREERLEIPAGTHQVRWVYQKDETSASGSDAAWVDQVQFIPGTPSVETLLHADFTSGLPVGWQVRDNSGNSATWTFNDPGGRGNLTGGDGAFAIADSDFAGQILMDTSLVTPTINLQPFTNITLEFKTDFFLYTEDEQALVEYSENGTTWSPLWRRFGTGIDGPATVRVNLDSLAGKTNVSLAFRFANADWVWWWQLDDVRLTATRKQAPPPPQLGIQATGSDMGLTWSATDGSYTLQYSTNLVEGRWLLAPGWVSNTPAGPDVMTYTNTLPDPFAAYRLLWQP